MSTARDMSLIERLRSLLPAEDEVNFNKEVEVNSHLYKAIVEIAGLINKFRLGLALYDMWKNFDYYFSNIVSEKAQPIKNQIESMLLNAEILKLDNQNNIIVNQSKLDEMRMQHPFLFIYQRFRLRLNQSDMDFDELNEIYLEIEKECKKQDTDEKKLKAMDKVMDGLLGYVYNDKNKNESLQVSDKRSMFKRALEEIYIKDRLYAGNYVEKLKKQKIYTTYDEKADISKISLENASLDKINSYMDLYVSAINLKRHIQRTADVNILNNTTVFYPQLNRKIAEFEKARDNVKEKSKRLYIDIYVALQSVETGRTETKNELLDRIKGIMRNPLPDDASQYQQLHEALSQTVTSIEKSTFGTATFFGLFGSGSRLGKELRKVLDANLPALQITSVKKRDTQPG